MDTKRLADSLAHKYGTRDPFEIAQSLDYTIIYVPLVGIRGFYQCIKRCHTIYLDSSLDNLTAKFVCAHELGHSLIHKGYNRIFMDTHTQMIDFSDIWTISQNVLSIALYLLNWLFKSKVLSIVCVVYAIYRLFELFVFLLNIFVLNDYRAQQLGNEFKLQSVPRSIINCFHNILELVFWFALIYSVIEHYGNTIWHYLLTSILTIANLDTSLLTMQGMHLLRIFVLLEAGWGIFLFMFILSKFIGGLPQNHNS